MQGHRQRLGHRAFGVAYAVSEFVGLARADDDLLAERTLHMGHAHGAAEIAHVQTMVLQSKLTKAALSARVTGIDGDAVAARQVLHARRHLFQHTRHLVPQHHGLLNANGAKTAVLEIVQIRAANAAGSNSHAHLVACDRWRGIVFDAQVAGRMDNESVHG